MISAAAVRVMWLREVKRFLRARSRVVGALAMPLFFLAFLGMGFGRMAVPGLSGPGGTEAEGGGGLSYLRFLVPGIVGMSMLFSSTFSGLAVLWDREFGFLKEIMVAPVSRVSIVLGRIAGGATTSLLQGFLLLAVSMVLGFRPAAWAGLAPALLFMLLIAVTFIGLGLVFASNMRDMQGFSLVMNFIMFPLLFLSGAIYPVKNLPAWLRALSYADPLTYGIDGMRGALLGVSAMPLELNLAAMAGFSALMVFLGAFFFERSKTL
jgi:ABC-2 type transport system permease protein